MNVLSAIRIVKSPVLPPAEEEEPLGRLYDVLIEHQPDDPDFGPPETWPAWTDCERAEDGAPLCREEVFGETEGPECGEPYEPSDLDLLAYDLWLERLEMERSLGINAHFR